MAIVAIVTGLVLTALGVGGYVATEMVSPTALIPAFFGLPLTLCGGLALNPKFLKHAMHGAATIGLLGALGAGSMGLRKLPTLLDGTAERPIAIVMQLVMGVVCAVFVGLCVRSFINVRKAREAAAKS